MGRFFSRKQRKEPMGIRWSRRYTVFTKHGPMEVWATTRENAERYAARVERRLDGKA